MKKTNTKKCLKKKTNNTYTKSEAMRLTYTYAGT